MGFRVPLLLISPWSRGGRVYSEFTDHTSTLQFLEKRFAVNCSNISPWRRAVASDLTAAFDFKNPDFSWPASFPDTTQNVNQSQYQCEHLPMPVVPTSQHFPIPEPGTRPSLPLPYDFEITDQINAATKEIALTMINSGKAAGVFMVYNRAEDPQGAYRFTVEPGQNLTYSWPLQGKYQLDAHGPNGFVRSFSGELAISASSVRVRLQKHPNMSQVSLEVSAKDDCSVEVRSGYNDTHALPIQPVNKRMELTGDRSAVSTTSVGGVGNWYDLTVSGTCNGHRLVHRYMGRLENGHMLTSDPALGQVEGLKVLAAWDHPAMPQAMRKISPWTRESMCQTERSRHKDACWAHEEL